jgi:hypothetical protein
MMMMMLVMGRGGREGRSRSSNWGEGVLGKRWKEQAIMGTLGKGTSLL